ncbi:MAG: hypothetical protein ABWY58_16040 [Aeromicrobium sp.]
MSIRRLVAFLGAAGLFVWILTLFFSGVTVRGDIPIADDSPSGYTAQQRDVGCSAISMLADGKETFDWPLGTDGDPDSATAAAVTASEALCDRFRDARSTQISVLSVPAVVLGVFALWGPRRRGRDVIAAATAWVNSKPAPADAGASQPE